MKRNMKKDILAIFDAGLKAANPREAIFRFMKMTKENDLAVGDGHYDMNDYERVFVVGAGKAVAPMTLAVEEILGDRINGGRVTTKYGHGLPLKKVELREAGHPVPDGPGVVSAGDMLQIAKEAGSNDLIFCLISGGGSALTPLPVEGITLEDKQKTTEELLKCGATIHEINAVRKHISAFKGGQLAKAAYPATVIALILSDVIGDDLDVIASGPTVPDRSTYKDCLDILKRYEIENMVPGNVLEYINMGYDGHVPETPKEGDPVFDNTRSHIIGSSRISLEEAKAKAVKLGYNSMILSSFIEGETKDVAGVHTAVIKEIIKTGNPVSRPACVISGGETTVTIHGSGLGGRNTEFVLAAARGIAGVPGAIVLSCGTDGTDGPTDAAGALADGETIRAAVDMRLNAEEYLRNNDSYHFFEKIDGLVKTGPTMTNVMDLRILLVE